METKAVSITGKEIACFPRSGQTHTERYPTGIFYIARVDEKKTWRCFAFKSPHDLHGAKLAKR